MHLRTVVQDLTLQRHCTDFEGPMSKYILKAPIDGPYFSCVSFFFGAGWDGEGFRWNIHKIILRALISWPYSGSINVRIMQVENKLRVKFKGTLISLHTLVLVEVI